MYSKSNKNGEWICLVSYKRNRVHHALLYCKQMAIPNGMLEFVHAFIKLKHLIQLNIGIDMMASDDDILQEKFIELEELIANTVQQRKADLGDKSEATIPLVEEDIDNDAIDSWEFILSNMQQQENLEIYQDVLANRFQGSVMQMLQVNIASMEPHIDKIIEGHHTNVPMVLDFFQGECGESFRQFADVMDSPTSDDMSEHRTKLSSRLVQHIDELHVKYGMKQPLDLDTTEPILASSDLPYVRILSEPYPKITKHFIDQLDNLDEDMESSTYNANDVRFGCKVINLGIPDNDVCQYYMENQDAKSSGILKNHIHGKIDGISNIVFEPMYPYIRVKLHMHGVGYLDNRTFFIFAYENNLHMACIYTWYSLHPQIPAQQLLQWASQVSDTLKNHDREIHRLDSLGSTYYPPPFSHADSDSNLGIVEHSQPDEDGEPEEAGESEDPGIGYGPAPGGWVPDPEAPGVPQGTPSEVIYPSAHTLNPLQHPGELEDPSIPIAYPAHTGEPPEEWDEDGAHMPPPSSGESNSIHYEGHDVEGLDRMYRGYTLRHWKEVIKAERERHIHPAREQSSRPPNPIWNLESLSEGHPDRFSRSVPVRRDSRDSGGTGASRESRGEFERQADILKDLRLKHEEQQKAQRSKDDEYKERQERRDRDMNRVSEEYRESTKNPDDLKLHRGDSKPWRPTRRGSSSPGSGEDRRAGSRNQRARSHIDELEEFLAISQEQEAADDVIERANADRVAKSTADLNESIKRRENSSSAASWGGSTKGSGPNRNAGSSPYPSGGRRGSSTNHSDVAHQQKSPVELFLAGRDAYLQRLRGSPMLPSDDGGRATSYAGPYGGRSASGVGSSRRDIDSNESQEGSDPEDYGEESETEDEKRNRVVERAEKEEYNLLREQEEHLIVQRSGVPKPSDQNGVQLRNVKGRERGRKVPGLGR